MLMKYPAVSIIIPVLNAQETIEKCIISLLNQNYPKNWYEIIVVDNNSTDKTSSILGQFKNKIIIKKEIKKGSYNARNTGIKNSKGNIILFTDSDCIANSNWISNIVKSFKNKNIKIVGGPIKAFKQETALQRYCSIFCHTQEDYCKANLFAASNMAVRKKDMQKTGLFEGFLKSGGDFFLCSNIIKNPSGIYYQPNAAVYHYYPKSLLIFIKKSFKYGRWNGIIRRRYNKHFHIKQINYYNLLKNYDFRFLYFRLVKDIFFKCGFIIGFLPKE